MSVKRLAESKYLVGPMIGAEKVSGTPILPGIRRVPGNPW